MPACVVLAAGGSRRAGAPPKALWEVSPGQSVLAHILDGARACELDPLLVVLGAHADALEGEASSVREVRVVRHAGWARGRTGSVKAGLRASDPPIGGTLLWPVDHPFVLEASVRALLRRARDVAPEGPLAVAVRRAAGGRRAPQWIVPCRGGERGHPIVLLEEAREEVLTYADEEPLFRYPRSHPEAVAEVPVDDPGVLENTDTPEDFARALDRYRGAHPPPGGPVVPGA